VYLLVCHDDGPVDVKIGVTVDPCRRALRAGTDTAYTPRQILHCRVSAAHRAREIEALLLRACAPWRTRGDWLTFARTDRAEFNRRLTVSLALLREPGAPLRWTRMDVRAIRDAVTRH
jgi:hypothetical protein